MHRGENWTNGIKNVLKIGENASGTKNTFFFFCKLRIYFISVSLLVVA